MTTEDLSCPGRRQRDEGDLDGSDDEALEEEFMEMIIASERVPSLLDNVSDARLSRARRRAALLELASLVARKRSYATAAADEGSALLSGVTSFLKGACGGEERDEEAMEAAAAVLAAAGGDSASGGGDVELYVSLPESSSSSLEGERDKRKKRKKKIRITQASLGDGLGARLWAAAPALLAALDGTRPPRGGADVKSFSPGSPPSSSASPPPLPPSAPPLAGATVLELGCGTGAGALAAVALGARSVSATDGEARVLEVAREGVLGTLSAWAREEREEAGVASPRRRRRRCCWDDPGGKLAMRRLWWGDGERKEEEPPSSPSPECEASSPSSSPADATAAEGELSCSPPKLCPACASAGPPHLDDDDGGGEDDEESRSLFDVVLAADVLYDDTSAPSLASEVASRLRREPSKRWVEETTKGGSPPPRPAAFLACPVRESRFLDDLVSSSLSRGLSITVARDDDAMDRARELGVKGAGKAGDYEGGFVFARLEWS